MSARSDLYSLGCALYHLLTGRPPFHDSKTPFDKMLRHQQAPVPPIRQRRPELCEGLVDLLDRMLAKDPMKRPSSAHEVAESLVPWCVGADLPGLLERALRSDPRDACSRGANVSTADDGAALADKPTALPSTTAHPGASDESPAMPRSGPASGLAHRWRWTRPVLAMATVFLLGLPVAWQFMSSELNHLRVLHGRGDPPLTVTSLSVHHYRVQGHDRLDDLRLIGPSGETVRVGDDVRVEARLSQSAYAYLLALNTDGSVRLSLPESDAEPPPRTDRLVLYPSPVDYFTLTECPGVQAFVVVASRRPLPAFRDSAFPLGCDELGSYRSSRRLAV